MVSAESIAPVYGYVQVVKDWPMPTKRSEVCTFFGKTGYYRRFVENYAEVAGPLTDIRLRTKLTIALHLTKTLKEYNCLSS
jgi:hypothetical protein